MSSTDPMTAQFDARRIRAITLDLDDTLWPVWPTIERAERRLRDWLDQHAPKSGALARDAEAAKAARRAALAIRSDNPHDLGGLRREAIRQLLARAGEDTHLAEPAFEVFYEERQRVVLYDDALPALAWLSARFRLVALTNGNADVHRVGIGHFFHDAINPVSAGVGKPDPRMFEAGAQAAGVAPPQVLHIGDDPHLDGAGALAVGMQMVWVNRAQAAWPDAIGAAPHLAVADLDALCRRLGAELP